MPVKIGTSGWQYRHWMGTFYPAGLAMSRWLGFYAGCFDTVEVDSAFYWLPPADVFARWREETPEGFVMAVKASRYLTHRRRLLEPREPVARLVERASHLGPKLGPVLLQLPPTMRVDTGRLDETLASFPEGLRVAVEARHDSWDCDAVWELLARRGAAWCIADAPWRRSPVVRTADWGYLRFHEGIASPRPCYGRRALAGWASRIAQTWPEGGDVYAYFNNDSCTCAPHDAQRFAAACTREGLRPSRVPGRGAVTLCA